MWLLWAIVLLVIGITLVLLEVLLPSGGLLSLLALGAIVGSVVLGFRHSSTAGMILILFILVFVPVTIVLGFKVFPHTPIGKRLILADPFRRRQTASRNPSSSVTEEYKTLNGKNGRSVTPLRPSGIAEIDDKRYSVVSQGQLIPKGVDIVVIKVEGNNIIVDPAEPKAV